MSMPLDERQYIDYINLLTEIIKPLQLLPLAAMAETNERMQTIAPFVNPTAYQRGGARNLDQQRRVIDGARALQRVVDDILLIKESA